MVTWKLEQRGGCEIFVVREGSNKKSYFTKIGAAWTTKSGSGYNADLIALPVDGKFILLPQKIRKMLQSNSARKAAGFGSPPSCGEIFRFDGRFQTRTPTLLPSYGDVSGQLVWAVLNASALLAKVP